MRTLLLILTLLGAPAPAFAAQRAVTFRTGDGCVLSAFYLAPSSGAYVFINTHGLGSTKEEWGVFQAALAKEGFGYLALDLRGHGGSTKCGSGEVNYRAFTAGDWNAASRDIEAAALYLRKKKVPETRLIFCGASIGANLSAKAAAEGPVKPAALVLLSPGLEYAGVKIYEHLLTARLPVFLAASQDDGYAYQSSAYLAAKAGGAGLRADFKTGPGGHGVNMFAKPGLAGEILDWAKKTGK